MAGPSEGYTGTCKYLGSYKTNGNGSLRRYKACWGGVSEMRTHYGPGYRIYFTQQGSQIVVLLNGGTKKTQTRDIKQAIEMASNL